MKKAEKKLKKVTFGDTLKVEKSSKSYFFGILKVKKKLQKFWKVTFRHIPKVEKS